jgi:acetylornithine deacetylase/succinyl-diaminopimelate desuccinylase-like protein
MNNFPSVTQIEADLVSQVRDVVDQDFAKRIGDLGRLVKIEGIAWDAFDAANLESSAEAVAELLRETGVFELVEIRRAELDGIPGSPAVVARRQAKNGKPTFLLYAHHDVQPPGNIDDWETPPFEPTLKNGRIYARGAADDKAGIVAHLTALETIRKVLGEDFDLGISVFIEGEEEAGSRTFRPFLNENRDILAADAIVVADSGNWTAEIPALTTTLRGMVSQVIEVSTIDHALHSGMYGGVVPDAMTAMIRLLASLHAPDGSVAVEGLVSGKAAELPYTEAELRRDSGAEEPLELIGSGSILDRIWTKPSITVIGIDGQSVALSSNTLLPKVKAKISMRIAPGDAPERALAALRSHLDTHVPFGGRIEYHEVELGKPFKADSSGWAQSLAETALEAAFENKTALIGIGGSIPFIADLTEVFPNAQILVTGVEDADSRAHSPNESVEVASLKKAMVAEALMLIKANELTE